MSSSDWWTPTSSSFHTPSRPNHLGGPTAAGSPFQPYASSSHAGAGGLGGSMSTPMGGGGGGGAMSRPRFAGDELDAEDVRMAEQIRFLPLFAGSPAGKLALGQSPGASGGAGGSGSGSGTAGGAAGAGGSTGGAGAAGSPPARRSPTARFSMQGGDSVSSPRDARRKTVAHVMDEDMPPTASLRDMHDAPAANTHASSSAPSIPQPPSLMASSSTTTLHVFGPPPSFLPQLERYLSNIGPLASYRPGPPGSNWYVAEFQSPTAASYALRRHGEIINGKWMLGFKVAGEGSTAGCTLVETGESGSNGGGTESGSVVRATGPGTPIRVQDRPILKVKEKQQVQGREEYGWDDQPPQGVTNRLAEWLFGR